METTSTQTHATQNVWKKWHSALFITMGLLQLIIVLVASPPVFSNTWDGLQGTFMFGVLIDTLFVKSIVLLPDWLTISVLILYLPFKHGKTKLSSAVLISLLSFYLVTFIVSAAVSIGKHPANAILSSLLFFVAPVLVLLLASLLSFRWSTQPFVCVKIETSGDMKGSLIQWPYSLFKKASDYSFEQTNVYAALATNVVLFIAIGKLIAFVIFFSIWILLPTLVYLILWVFAIVAVVVLFDYIFLDRAIFGTSFSKIRSYKTSDKSYPSKENCHHSDSLGDCHYAGRILIDKKTTVLGFDWMTSDTLFIITKDWKVKLKGKEYGWIDKKGQIRHGIGGDPDATMDLRPIVGKIEYDTLYIDGEKIGKLVNW